MTALIAAVVEPQVLAGESRMPGLDDVPGASVYAA
jgi:hypothetical protein